MIRHKGFIVIADKSIIKIDPLGWSKEVWQNGPESVKYRQKLFYDKINELGPKRGIPSKSLINSSCLV